MNYKKDISKIAKILIADSDYIYDPDHEKNPGSGYKKTDKGWSKNKGKTEEDFSNGIGNGNELGNIKVNKEVHDKASAFADKKTKEEFQPLMHTKNYLPTARAQFWQNAYNEEVQRQLKTPGEKTNLIDGWKPKDYAQLWGGDSTPAARHFYDLKDDSVVKDERFYDELFNGKLGIKELLKRISDSLQGKGEYKDFGYSKKDSISLGQLALHIANEARKNGIDIDKIVDGKSDNTVKKPEKFSKEKKMKLVREMPGYWSGLNKLQRERLSWDDFHSRVMDGSIPLDSDEALAMAAVLKIKQEEQLSLAEALKKRENDQFAKKALVYAEREIKKLGNQVLDFKDYSIRKENDKNYQEEEKRSEGLARRTDEVYQEIADRELAPLNLVDSLRSRGLITQGVWSSIRETGDSNLSNHFSDSEIDKLTKRLKEEILQEAADTVLSEIAQKNEE